MKRFWNTLWHKIKHLPTRKQAILAIIAGLIVIGLGILIWAIATGRIKPRADTVCPAGSVCNTASVSYDGLNGSILSNTVVTQIDNTPTNPTININLTLQGKTDSSGGGTILTVYPAGQTTPVITKADVTTDATGKSSFTVTGLTVGTNYDFKIMDSPNELRDLIFKKNEKLIMDFYY